MVYCVHCRRIVNIGCIVKDPFENIKEMRENNRKIAVERREVYDKVMKLRKFFLIPENEFENEQHDVARKEGRNAISQDDEKMNLLSVCCDLLANQRQLIAERKYWADQLYQLDSVYQQFKIFKLRELEQKNEQLCMACWDRDRDTWCMPCKCLVLCQQCAQQHDYTSCPHCRKDKKELISL